VGVVDPQEPAILAVAEPDPRTDPFWAQQNRRRRFFRGLFQPERAALDFLKSGCVEEDRTVLAGRPAVIAADPDPAVTRQHGGETG